MHDIPDQPFDASQGITVLVTGGAGFIGTNFVQMLAELRPLWKIVNLDALTYAGNLENLEGLRGDPRHEFLKGDITSDEDVDRAFAACKARGGKVCVVHFAAESHVDRSILSGRPFVLTNMLGTQVLLDHARKNGAARFVHVSTDEVYGTLGPTGAFTEETPLAPNSPYSSSKAGSDLLVRAAVHLPHLVVVAALQRQPQDGPQATRGHRFVPVRPDQGRPHHVAGRRPRHRAEPLSPGQGGVGPARLAARRRHAGRRQGLDRLRVERRDRIHGR